MKNTHNKAGQHRSLRRFIRKLFLAGDETLHCDHQTDIQTIIVMLQEIRESIDIIAREIARQIKANK